MISEARASRRTEELLGEHLLVPPDQMDDTLELVVGAASVPVVLRSLREDPELRYDILADLAGVDTGRSMQVVYHLWSALHPGWLRVIADGLSREDPSVASITFLWPGAEWAEREAYDMLGIVFEGNRDLRRIYMPPHYLGFPLRKDFFLADDASRAPGQGIRPMEAPHAPAEARHPDVVRLSPGTGAVIGPDGQRLSLAQDEAGSGERPGVGPGGGS
ncbi:hypothetical protein BH23CHL8_BH23CHL8_18610 [soil metagenome]